MPVSRLPWSARVHPDQAGEPQTAGMAAPVVAGAWTFRLFAFLGSVALLLTPLTFVMPNPDWSGGIAVGLAAGAGFLTAAFLSRRARARAGLVAATITLLVVAMLGAATLDDFDPAALGIA